MKIKRLTIIIPALVFLSPLSAENSVREDAFPMNEGTYWVYQGSVRWTLPDSRKVKEDTVTWRMGIVETIERDGITAAVIKGHPADLAWYDENKQPGDYLIVEYDTGKYYLIRETRLSHVLGRLRDTRDDLDSLVLQHELFLDLPLSLDKTFGGWDNDYHWQVIEVDSLDPWLIRDLPLFSFTRYRLALVTLPDHTTIDFIPGIGITAYSYVHHGTVSEVKVKLVDFRVGGKDE